MAFAGFMKGTQHKGVRAKISWFTIRGNVFNWSDMYICGLLCQ